MLNHLLTIVLLSISVDACIKVKNPIYICTHPITNIDYYSSCISDLATGWQKVNETCGPKNSYYTAECVENIKSVAPHITSHVRVAYHRTWWAHRLRPMTNIPLNEGIYQSLNHSPGVMQDQLCIRPCTKDNNCVHLHRLQPRTFPIPDHRVIMFR